MLLVVLAAVLPLLFFPRRATTGTPAEAGEGTFLLPRWCLLVLLAPLVASANLEVLDVALVALVVAQTLRSPSRGPTLRGAVWIGGLAVHVASRTIEAPWRDLLAGWWWAPFLLVMLYAWSQLLWPGWDMPWCTTPVPAFNPAWVEGSANAAEVAEAFRQQSITLATLPPGFTSDPPSDVRAPTSLGGSHYTAEILAAVAVAAPWPVAFLALGTMVALRSRLPLAIAAVVLAFFLPVPRPLALVLGVTMALVLVVLCWRRTTLPTAGVRWIVWKRTGRLIARYPWVGIGTGNYAARVQQGSILGERPWVSFLATAHSEYLERAAEWGIPGGLVFLVWVALHAAGRPAALALALGAVAGHSLYHPVGWFLFCLLSGIR
jgi:hypothetical protein